VQSVKTAYAMSLLVEHGPQTTEQKPKLIVVVARHNVCVSALAVSMVLSAIQ